MARKQIYLPNICSKKLFNFFPHVHAPCIHKHQFFKTLSNFRAENAILEVRITKIFALCQINLWCGSKIAEIESWCFPGHNRLFLRQKKSKYSVKPICFDYLHTNSVHVIQYDTVHQKTITPCAIISRAYKQNKW